MLEKSTQCPETIVISREGFSICTFFSKGMKIRCSAITKRMPTSLADIISKTEGESSQSGFQKPDLASHRQKKGLRVQLRKKLNRLS